MNEENITLKETFEKLDEIIEKMQGQELSLEETFALYKQGVALVHSANEKIEKVECDIKVLEETQE